MEGNNMLDPERSVNPPEVIEKQYICPICGMPANTIYKDNYYNVFGCDFCVKSDLIDDILNIDENQPLPKCHWCGTREQTVYIDKYGEIRACFKCVKLQEP